MIPASIRLIATLVLGTLAAPLEAGAQDGARVPRIGILQVTTPATAVHLLEAFKEGMRERGYVEGERVVFVARFGEGRSERVRKVAAELVRLKVDIIVTATDQAISAVKQQTRTIPIVMANSTDPVGTGFVASLARPGGNITGNSAMSPELSGKRLELLREIVPRLSRVAILWDPDIRGAVLDYRETEGSARSLRMQLPVHVAGGLTNRVDPTHRVRHEAARIPVDDGEPVPLGEARDLAPVRKDEGTHGRHEP